MEYRPPIPTSRVCTKPQLRSPSTFPIFPNISHQHCSSWCTVSPAGGQAGGYLFRARSQASVTTHFWVIQMGTESQVCPSSPSTPVHSPLALKQSLCHYPASSSPCSTPKAWVRPASISQGKPEEAQAVAPETQNREWLTGHCLFFPVIRKSHWGDSRETISCQGSWDPS